MIQLCWLQRDSTNILEFFKNKVLIQETVGAAVHAVLNLQDPLTTTMQNRNLNLP
jgi:RIO-like serine/threonine protein kinase